MRTGRRSALCAIAIAFLNSCVTQKQIAYPVGMVCPKIGSDFGAYSALGGGTRPSPHNGIDISAPIGTPVIAAADGDAMIADYNACGGNLVILFHGQEPDGTRVWSAYAHMQTINIKRGQNVKRGEQIGTLGKTGNCVGYEHHLHFDIYVGNTDQYELVSSGGGISVRWDLSNGRSRRPASPHDFWYSTGNQTPDKTVVPAFDKRKSYDDQPRRMTYPVPCKSLDAAS